jgi:hypothetical protein
MRITRPNQTIPLRSRPSCFSAELAAQLAEIRRLEAKRGASQRSKRRVKNDAQLMFDFMHPVPAYTRRKRRQSTSAWVRLDWKATAERERDLDD